tara:strand:- start:18290 stop:19150 length:861 start_codon:yes stop_codon:yes gene_type:complete
MLNKIINDPNLIWDSSSIKINDLFFPLHKKLVNQNFSEKTVKDFRDTYLDKGKGIGIIDLNQITNNITEQKNIYFKIVDLLGFQLKQNLNGDKVVEIKDEGKSIKTGGRYHETREGGSLHTDCPQWEQRPDYLSLFCVRPSIHGGIGKFISAYTIHNELLANHKDELKILYNKFHFDKREDAKGQDNQTVYKPIFEFGDNSLSFRYLSDYIRDGHIRINKPLTVKQNKALDVLDSLLSNEKFMIELVYKSGYALFANNYRIIHGRNSFKDSTKYSRLLLRTWISKR